MKPLSVLCSHELACPGPLQHDQHKHLKQTQTLIYVLLIPDVFNAKNKEDQSSCLPYPLLREKASIALNTLGYKHVSNFGHVSVSQCVQCTNAQNTSHVSLLIHQSILSKKQHLYPPSCQKCAQIVYPRLDFGHVSISQCVQCTNAQNTSHVSLLIHQSILSKKQHPYPPSCQKCAQIVHPRLDKHSKPAHQNKIQSTLYIHESPCPYVSLVLKTARALDLVTLFDLEFHVFRPVMMKAPQYHCHPRKIILTGISSNKFLVSLSFPVGIAKYHRVPRPTIPFTHFIKQFPRIR